MLGSNEAPYTIGMEIEQFPRFMPDGVDRSGEGTLDDWHTDGSGPRETDIGPYKNAKTILNRFLAGTRDEYGTWDWHAADTRRETNGNGAGSHLHLCLNEDVFDDRMVGWTISYNSIVELAPIFAPFWCHNWQMGFREGTRSSRGLNGSYWAGAQTTRYSQDSLRQQVNGGGRTRRYDAVTLNPSRGDKPVTVELRMNDAHPTMALTGALLLRRVVGRCVEAGWSPKFENHNASVQSIYDKIYERAADVGLMEAMQEPLELTFQDERGIPGVDQRSFANPFNILKAIMRAYPQTPHSWSYRAARLVTQGRDDYSPHLNPNAIWNVDVDRGEFSWENGPDIE